MDAVCATELFYNVLYIYTIHIDKYIYREKALALSQDINSCVGCNVGDALDAHCQAVTVTVRSPPPDPSCLIAQGHQLRVVATTCKYLNEQHAIRAPCNV